MRLGQLARKFDITPQEIVTYLQSKGIEANPHPNSKLDENAEALVMEHFDILPSQPDEEEITEVSIGIPEPEISQEVESELDSEPEEVVEEAAIEEPVAIVETPKPETSAKSVTIGEILQSEEEGSEIDFQVVKAAKVELTGLTVVGKIDLPEPKKKTLEEEQAEKEAKELAREERNKKRNKNGRYRQPLSDEEREKRRLQNKEWKQKREEQKARKKKQQEEAQKKAAKEAHYKEKLAKAPASTKPKKVVKKKKKLEEPQNHLPQPKTVFGKIWRWLNT